MSDIGTLYVGKDTGFNGQLTKLSYFNYALEKNDLLKFYNQGPN
jgi:hypothetical protein